MATDVWHPLSAREAGTEGFRESMPPALRVRVRAWLMLAAEHFPDLPFRVLLRLDTVLSGEADRAYPGSDWRLQVTFASTKRLLDMADAMLSLIAETTPTELSQDTLAPIVKWSQLHIDLDQDLTDARSVYQVKSDGTGLQRRVAPVAAEMLAAAVNAAAAKPDAGSAAAQLRAASDAVRALNPDPEKAYSQAIKAVESAAHAIIEPKNRKATLGTMLGIMRANPTRFELAITTADGIAPVVGMMTLLWEGQSSRHGAQTPTPTESREAAEMAVELASMLVLWFTTGMVRRAP